MSLYCVDCGNEVRAEDIFCSKCGNNVEVLVDEESNECRICNATLEDDQVYCSQCGARAETILASQSESDVEIGTINLGFGSKKILMSVGLALAVMMGLFLLFNSNLLQSQSYKDGWNDQHATLDAGLLGYSELRKVSCRQLAETYVEWRGLDISSGEFQDYIRGCEDWRVSGEAGLERK